MKLWLIQAAVACIVLIGLVTLYELADVDTNIDTGNTLAIAVVDLVFVWLLVACLGAAITFAVRMLRRRR